MGFTLRPYQDAALSAIAESHKKSQSVLVEMATGLGKTVIFSRYASSWEHGRTMVICPIITLIGQAAKKLHKETGIMPAVEQAGEWSNENEWARSPYVVASKQTLCSKWHGEKKRYERFEDVGLVIVDECVTGDSIVVTEKGPVRIDEIPALNCKAVLSHNGRDSVMRKITHWVSKGKKPVLHIRTTTGSIRCTENHMLMTMDGWKKAEALTTRDRILYCASADAKLPYSKTSGDTRGDGSTDTILLEDRESSGGKCMRTLSPMPLCASADVARAYVHSQNLLTTTSPSTVRVDIPGSSRGITAGRYQHLSSLHLTRKWQFLEHFSETAQLDLLTHTAPTHDYRQITLQNKWSGHNGRQPLLRDLAPDSQSHAMMDTAITSSGLAHHLCHAFTKFTDLSKKTGTENTSRWSGLKRLEKSDSHGGSETMDRVAVGLCEFTQRGFLLPKTTQSPRGLARHSEKPPSTALIAGTITSAYQQTRSEQFYRSYPVTSQNLSNTNWSQVVSVQACPSEEVYDITVDDTHCFFANGLLVHNCHYVATEQYAELIRWFTDRGAKVLGLTATAKRHDGRAMGQVFDDCCYQYGIVEAIDDGWLVSPRVVCKQLQHLDLTEVETTSTFLGRDFNQKQLNEKLEDVQVIYEIAEAVDEETRGEKTAIFCASVNEAQAVSELLADRYGIQSGWICSDTTRCTEQRKTETLNSFTSDDPGSITHLCNVGMITTGFDFPALKNIVMARPTKSLALYTQIIGRATRPLDGVVDFDDSTPETRKQRIAESAKPNFRVIDLVDNSLNHKLITTVDVLGGKWSLAMREEVFKEALAKGREVDLTEEMLAIIRAKELEEERRLRAARAARQAQATFANVAVDPFGDQRGTVRDRQQRDMATEKQCRYLWVLGFKDINSYSLTKAQAGRAIHQLKELGMSVQEVKRTNKLRPTSEQQLMPATAKQTPQPIHPAGDDEMFSLFR